MVRAIFTMAACLAVVSTAWAQAPQLEGPHNVTLADGSVLDVGGVGHSTPDYADVDGDGIPDLVVGEFKDGAIRIYRNHGSAEAPIFKDFEFLMADGEQAVVPPS